MRIVLIVDVGAEQIGPPPRYADRDEERDEINQSDQIMDETDELETVCVLGMDPLPQLNHFDYDQN